MAYPLSTDGTTKSEKTESYTYDGRGNMLTKTDRNGDTITFTYDVHNRMLTLSGKDVNIVQTYDGSGNKLTMTDESGETVRTYDELNRVLSKATPGIGTTIYTYDITGNIPAGYSAEKTVDPKNNVTIKIYDKVGRIKEIKDSESAVSTVYEYYDNGSVKSVAYPDGTSENYEYYSDNQLKTLINKNTSGIAIDTYTYTYDGAHNQDSKTEVINGVSKGTTNYTYDELNRLKTVTEPSNKLTSYEYDKAGNRKNETVTLNGQTTTTVYNYNEQERLITTVAIIGDITTTTTYYYDNNGNLYSKSLEKTEPDAQTEEQVQIVNQGTSLDENGVAIYEYNVLNELVKAADGNSITENVYNGEGLRVSKNINGSITLYSYEYDKVVLETDGNGNQLACNVCGTNLISRTVGGETLYYLYNGHADVTALLDSDGVIVAYYYYDAFGNPVQDSTNEGDIDNPIRYAGYQWDEETGLYYLNARFYDATIARFIQEDTFGGYQNDPLSLNKYSYCYNNPIKYFDPTGHTPEEEALIASAYRAYQGGFIDTKAFVDNVKTNNGTLTFSMTQSIVARLGGMNTRDTSNIYHVLYGVPSGVNRDTQANPWSDGTGTAHLRTNQPYDQYDNYKFTEADALIWLIMGGNSNFLFQARSTTDTGLAAGVQEKMINAFFGARDLLTAGGFSVNPKLFIGSTEFDGGSALEIYKTLTENRGWSASQLSMIGGIYYGKEDPENPINSIAAAKHVHGQGKQMVWVPYVDWNDGYSLDNVVNFATSTYGANRRQLFDVAIIQPGVFYDGAGYNDSNLRRFGWIINKINENTTKTRLGIEFEFDMGMVTGRGDSGGLNPWQKRGLFNEYLKAIYPFVQGGKVPIGIYSGGPNEQGMNNIYKNINSHNSGNHQVCFNWNGDYSANGVLAPADWYSYGVYYDHFPDRYADGNLIYDINNFIYRDVWAPGLSGFGLINPK